MVHTLRQTGFLSLGPTYLVLGHENPERLMDNILRDPRVEEVVLRDLESGFRA